MKQETLRNYLFKMTKFIVYNFFVEHLAGRALLKSERLHCQAPVLDAAVLALHPLQSLGSV